MLPALVFELIHRKLGAILTLECARELNAILPSEKLREHRVERFAFVVSKFPSSRDICF